MHETTEQCRGKTEKARNVLTESVRLYPCNWSTWKALNAVCSEWEDVISLNLPEHFMREMFLAVMCLELHWCGEALSRMEELSETFPRSRFLILKAACAHYNSRKMDEAQVRSHLAACNVSMQCVAPTAQNECSASTNVYALLLYQR
jgi:hypothetical protein